MKQSPPAKKRKRQGVLVFYYIFWATILILLFALFITQMENYNELRAEYTRLNAEIERERAENLRLTEHIDSLDSDAYVERFARDVLGMVRPNEIVFRNTAE